MYRSSLEDYWVPYVSHKLLVLRYQSPRTRSFSRDPQVYVSRLHLSRHNAAHGARILLMVGHGEKLHDVPDEYLNDSLIVAKKIAVASGFENYNILQARDYPTSLYHFLLTYLDPSEQRKNCSSGESCRTLEVCDSSLANNPQGR